MPPENEFTPIPGFKLVDRETYEEIIAKKGKANQRRVTEIMPAIGQLSLERDFGDDSLANNPEKKGNATSKKGRIQGGGRDRSPFHATKRISELIELKQQMWFAVPDDDPYRTISCKEYYSEHAHRDNEIMEESKDRVGLRHSESDILQVSDILGEVHEEQDRLD